MSDRRTSAAVLDQPGGARPGPHPGPLRRQRTVAVVGLGYVGLPTALALHRSGAEVLGVDTSVARRERIARRSVDLPATGLDELDRALHGDRFVVTGDPAAVEAADGVVVCVPTPVDERRRPELTALEAACRSAVAGARRGQTIVLTSTAHVGATRELLVGPLRARGLRPGFDVHVAFCPERIDPGRVEHAVETVPRIVGGATPGCAEAATSLLDGASSAFHVVSSPEAAELAKLIENTFRAVNISLANEFAAAASAHGLDVLETIEAAATKPFGFMPFFPGAGVGGHCIPCDPHYLTAGLVGTGTPTPVIAQAMASIDARPWYVARRAVEVLLSEGVEPGRARVLIAGLAYKPGVADVRESPALSIAAHLRGCGVEVVGWDPNVDGQVHDVVGVPIENAPAPPGDVDLLVLHTVDPTTATTLVGRYPLVLDTTYRLAGRADGVHTP